MNTIVGTPAKRGDIFVYPIVHSAFYLKGGRQERQAFVFGEVTSVTRDGQVKKHYRFHSGSRSEGDRPAQLWLIHAKINKEAMRRELTWDSEFESLGEAKAFVRKFIRN